MEGVGNVGLAPSTQPTVISMLLPRKGQALRNVSIQVSYQIPKYVVTNVDTNVEQIEIACAVFLPKFQHLQVEYPSNDKRLYKEVRGEGKKVGI